MSTVTLAALELLRAASAAYQAAIDIDDESPATAAAFDHYEQAILQAAGHDATTDQIASVTGEPPRVIDRWLAILSVIHHPDPCPDCEALESST